MSVTHSVMSVWLTPIPCVTLVHCTYPNSTGTLGLCTLLLSLLNILKYPLAEYVAAVDRSRTPCQCISIWYDQSLA